MAKSNNNNKIHKTLIDFPAWVITSLDKEAERMGVARSALIKIWIINKIDEIEKQRIKDKRG